MGASAVKRRCFMPRPRDLILGCSARLALASEASATIAPPDLRPRTPAPDVVEAIGATPTATS